MNAPYLYLRSREGVALAFFPIFLGVLALTCPAFANGGEPEAISFDVQTMKSRGLDPTLANMFSQAPHFMAGTTQVILTVNGVEKGRVSARFDDNGKLCADTDFQKQAGLVPFPHFSANETCFDLKKAWPQTELNLDSGEGRIDLVVPADAVAVSDASDAQWKHGGTAAMINYDVQYMDTAGSHTGTHFTQLDTETGFNVHDWIVRSRQSFSRLNGEASAQYQTTYAQKSFSSIKKVLQTGQISLSNSMFGTGQVWGVQMFPEAALQNTQGGAGIVEGIADTQSVVEVRQSGALIYSTTVPAGPFRLQGFSLLNTRSDLDVNLTGSNGEKHSFTVPASAFMMNGPAVAPGLSFGAGKLDQNGSSVSPVVATVASGWVLSPKASLNAGLIGSSLYRAAAASLDAQPLNATQLSLQATAAQDSNHGDNGASVMGMLSRQLSERLGANLNTTRQTSGYRELSDAITQDDQGSQGHTREQYGAGISWAMAKWGNLSLSVARSSTFQGDHYLYLRGGWSKQFDRASVSVSMEHNASTNPEAASGTPENRLYVTLSIPLDTRNISSYINNASNGSRAGVNYSDRSNPARSWRLSTERDYRDNSNTYMGSVDTVTPISQLNASISQESTQYTSWSTHASGSMVAHQHGLTLSPYQVGDTFGIAKVGDESGVKLDTPAGPTWTDRNGYAVLPSLSGYRRSAVEVDTRSLPKNIDIGNAAMDTEGARGSVSYVSFDVVRTRRVLVDVKDASDKPVPHGASVFDASSNFVTVVGEKGEVFISDAKPGMTLDVQSSGHTLCSFTLVLPEKADTDTLFENARSVCH